MKLSKNKLVNKLDTCKEKLKNKGLGICFSKKEHFLYNYKDLSSNHKSHKAEPSVCWPALSILCR